ncbi:MAG: hypothetical protein IH587_06270 [Anaerolineae bacterium]|nr:hypothetical protein [Anaerolineae bacterium]
MAATARMNAKQAYKSTRQPTIVNVALSAILWTTAALLLTSCGLLDQLLIPGALTDGAANADVIYVRAVESTGGTWTFHVTVQHPDTGWENYADGWDVVTPDGTVIQPDPDSPFTRLLLHPHVEEQPFTRSQGGIVIPSGVTQVTVRAHDLVAGFGGREILVDLTSASGDDYEVVRAS